MEGSTRPEFSTRRKFVVFGAAAAGAVAATVITGDRADAHGTVHFDSANSDPAVHGNNTSDGPGVQGDSVTGHGVLGHTAGAFQAAGVKGMSDGTDLNSYGVFGFSTTGGVGVEGQSINGHGVEGISHHGAGVAAGSLDGIAFDGFAPAGIAALRLGGKVRLSTVAFGTIPAGSRDFTVPHGQVTDKSHVSVTFTSDPGGRAVEWISRVAAGPGGAGGSFTLHLDGRLRADTTFTYSILEPFSP
jgi:hypothetical protein